MIRAFEHGKIPSPAILAFLTGVIGYLVVLKAWWVADDWNFLAAVRGIAPAELLGARMVSQRFYWLLFEPLLGLQAIWWAALRLTMHGMSAVLVTRIAARCGLDRAAQAVAGILFASASVAFTPLYWNCGAEELLGALLALAAMERWLADRRLAALLLGAAAILAKESAFAVPMVFALLTLFRPEEHRRQAWLIIAGLLLLAVAESFLVYRHFHVLQDSPDYATGSVGRALLNLCLLAWFAVIPLRFHMIARYLSATSFIVGGAVLATWLFVAVWQGRRGNRLPAACLYAAVCSVAATLPLATHIHSYYAYLAMAPAALTLASLLIHRRIGRPGVIWGLAIALTSYTGLAAIQRTQDEEYFLVKSQRISQQISQQMRELSPAPGDEVIIVRYGNAWHRKIHSAISGITGPQVLLGRDVTVRWVDSLTMDEIRPNTHVFVEQKYQLRKADLSKLGPQGFAVE